MQAHNASSPRLPMLQHLARTVRTLSGHVGASSLPAQQRIARWLLGQPTGEDGTIRTTHEEIGQFTLFSGGIWHNKCTKYFEEVIPWV